MSEEAGLPQRRLSYRIPASQFESKIYSITTMHSCYHRRMSAPRQDPVGSNARTFLFIFLATKKPPFKSGGFECRVSGNPQRLSRSDWHNLASCRSSKQLTRTTNFLLRITDHFVPLSDPTNCTCHRKDAGKQIRRNAKRALNNT
jgi:hypothetical protein